MQSETNEGEFQVVAKECDFGACPTVLEGGRPGDLVIVGKLDAAVLNSADVQKHTGEGEIAVVIPKRLLISAAKALA